LRDFFIKLQVEKKDASTSVSKLKSHKMMWPLVVPVIKWLSLSLTTIDDILQVGAMSSHKTSGKISELFAGMFYFYSCWALECSKSLVKMQIQ
jgi:hypothetical protein